MESPRPKRARRAHSDGSSASKVAAETSPQQQVFLKRLQIEGFKTFCESETIDICPGWQPRPCNGVGLRAPSPLTIVFGGNGAGKSALLDGVCFVLSGQSSKSIRSSGGSAQLVNDQSVLQRGPDAFASVTITFQKAAGCQDMDTDSADDHSVEGTKVSNYFVEELLVGRSVKHTTGTSSYSVQGKICSRALMMQTLNAFVGIDMGDVDRYLLKQGSTMVCRRHGKELLSFIERLAGTARLKAEVEEVQANLDDVREEALSLETDLQSSVHIRRVLQPQVEAFLTYQSDEKELQQEKVGLWRRKLAVLRVRLDAMESAVAQNEREAKELRRKIKSSKVQHECMERSLTRATQAAEKALRSQTEARGKVRKAQSAQAEAEALAQKTIKSVRANATALTRTRKLLEGGEAEITGLLTQASSLESASKSVKARIDDLERAPELNMPGGEWFDRREELVRELSALEEGPLPELEKFIAERTGNLAQASELLDKLVSDAVAARRKMEHADELVKSSQNELNRLKKRTAEIDAESAGLRAHCALQQALVGNLEAQRMSHVSIDTDVRSPPANDSSTSTKGRGAVSWWQQPVNAHERVDALRSLMEKLRKGGVGAHGMLADIVLLRRPCDEVPVSAVFGAALRNTVVVQTRKDGARVVAEIREAGISGQVRCNVLDELKGTPSTSAARDHRGGNGLSPLVERVTTSDPRHLPAAEKHLGGWLIAETRELAWSARNGSSTSSAANVVTSSGELFYASGEVAVKPPRASTPNTPRLFVLQSGQHQHQRQQQGGPSQMSIQQQAAMEKGVNDIELRLKGALEALSVAETRAAELEGEAGRARFGYEDAKAVHATAQTMAKECRREVVRMDQKVSAQRCLIAAGNKGCTPADADEVQLENLRQRRDRILADLALVDNEERDPGSQRGAGRIGVAARAAAILELRTLRAEADTNRELQDEVGVKLRVLTKRVTTRRHRVESLTKEKKALEAQQLSMKAQQLVHSENITNLLSALEGMKSVYRDKREAARDAEVVSRKGQRQLSAFEAARTELSKRQESLTEDCHIARAGSSRLARFLVNASRNATEADGVSPRDVLHREAGAFVKVGAAGAEAAACLARELDMFLLFPIRNSCGDGDERRGGGPSRNERRREEEDSDSDLEADGREKGSPETRGKIAEGGSVCGEEDEAKVAELVRILKADNGEGGGGGGGGGQEESDFSKERGIEEASIRLKEADLQKRRKALDVSAITQAVRLDRDSAALERNLATARQSVLVLMDKREVLEATRHNTLVKCLEDVNNALGSIYRRLTSVEEPGHAVGDTTSNSNAFGNFGVRGAPGGDCFLRFSRERSLLLREGLSVQVKPEAASPWRGPECLSGGQVALVGLALNLATQAVRPAPLYLMDEIDSALDTTKVRCVAKMLADRARNGNEQCVVISHRPEMHKRGSHLVGVYHCEGTARTVGLELLSQLGAELEDGSQYGMLR